MILLCVMGAAFCARFLLAVSKERRIGRIGVQRLRIDADEVFPKHSAGNELALNKAGCMNRLAPPVEVSKAEARTTIQSKLRWVIMVLVIAATRLSAQTADSSDEIQQLKALVLQLQTRVSQLETQASKRRPSVLMSRRPMETTRGNRQMFPRMHWWSGPQTPIQPHSPR